jgi:phosphoribosylamine-glycine ligase
VARQRRHRAGRGWKTSPITDVKELREWAQAEKIALTVVGPEAAAGGWHGR